jgi:hypothetical protein
LRTNGIGFFRRASYHPDRRRYPIIRCYFCGLRV